MRLLGGLPEAQQRAIVVISLQGLSVAQAASRVGAQGGEVIMCCMHAMGPNTSARSGWPWRKPSA